MSFRWHGLLAAAPTILKRLLLDVVHAPATQTTFCILSRASIDKKPAITMDPLAYITNAGSRQTWTLTTRYRDNALGVTTRPQSNDLLVNPRGRLASPHVHVLLVPFSAHSLLRISLSSIQTSSSQ